MFNHAALLEGARLDQVRATSGFTTRRGSSMDAARWSGIDPALVAQIVMG